MDNKQHSLIENIIYFENKIFVLEGTVNRIKNQFGEKHLDDQFLRDLYDKVYSKINQYSQKMEQKIHEYDTYSPEEVKEDD